MPPLHERARAARAEAEALIARVALLEREWNEGEHPRDEGGRFGEGGGGADTGGDAKPPAEGAKPDVRVSGGGGKNLEKIKAGIASMPKEHQAALKDIPIFSTKTIVNNGRQIAGAYIKDPGIPPQVRIADEIKGSKLKDPEGTAVHEMGHALDYQTGMRLSKEISPLVSKDADKMNAADKYLSQHYLSNERELAAEIYRLAFCQSGKGAFGMGQKKAEKVFATSLKAMREWKL